MNVNSIIGRTGHFRDTGSINKATNQRAKPAQDSQIGAIKDIRSVTCEPSTRSTSLPPIRTGTIQHSALAALCENTAQEQIGTTENIASGQSSKDESASEPKAKKSDEEYAYEWNALISDKIKAKIEKNNDFEQAKARKEGFTNKKTELEEFLQENYELFTDKIVDELKWKIEKAGLYAARVQARMDIITKPTQEIQPKAKVSKNMRVCFAEDGNGNVAAEVKIFQPVRIIPASITRLITNNLNIDSSKLTDEQMEDLGGALVENGDEILTDFSAVAKVICSLGIELVANEEQLALLALTLIELDEEPDVDKIYRSASLNAQTV